MRSWSGRKPWAAAGDAARRCAADARLTLGDHPERIAISDGRWSTEYAGYPLSGRVALSVGNWQQGTEQMRVSGRLNVLTHGEGGKGNAVLTIGHGKLSMDNSDMPLQLTGEAKLGDLIVYAVLPANLTGR